MTQLYLISPPKIEPADFAKQLETALTAVDKGFTTAFQLRLKETSDEQIRTAIQTLMPICRAHDCVFIINDRVDLCLEFSCDGVHVGQEDLEKYSLPLAGGLGGAVSSSSALKEPPLNPPRKREGNAIAEIRSKLSDDMALGITCHASKHLAMEAAEAGADYVAFGAFHPTTSKPSEKLKKWGTPTPDILKWWSEMTEVPCVAIGGITPENCKPLVNAGTDFIAVITAIWNHPKGTAEAVREFFKQVES